MSPEDLKTLKIMLAVLEFDIVERLAGIIEVKIDWLTAERKQHREDKKVRRRERCW